MNIDERIAALEAKAPPRRRKTVEECLELAERSKPGDTFWLTMAKNRRILDEMDATFREWDDAERERPALTLIEGGTE